MIEATSPTDALTGETEAGRCNGWDRAAGGDRAHGELPGGTAPPAPVCGHLPKGQVILILRVASLGAGPAAIRQIPPCPQHPGARTAALPEPPRSTDPAPPAPSTPSGWDLPPGDINRHFCPHGGSIARTSSAADTVPECATLLEKSWSQLSGRKKQPARPGFHLGKASV